MASQEADLLTLQQYRMRQGNLLRRAHKVAVALFTEACSGLGVTRPQFEAVMAIARFPGLDQITLARTLGIDRSTTTLILDGLAERALIDRSVDPADRRKRVLRLTETGTQVLTAARQGARQAQARLLAGLSNAEAETLASSLRTVVTRTPSRAPPWSMPEDGPEADYLVGRPGFLLRRTVQIGFALFDVRASEAGLDLTPTQYGFLFFLKVMPADHANIARLVGVERSTSDRLLERLKARGYIAKRPQSEKSVLRLSAKGDEVFQCARRLSEAADAEQFSCLSPAEQARLLDVLDKLVFFHEA